MSKYSQGAREVVEDNTNADLVAEESLTNTGKTTWSKIWPIMAAGSGLFSEGYLQNVSSKSTHDSIQYTNRM